MLSKRQTDILKEIVEEYIKSAKPVGSIRLCEVFDYSSATLRAEMATLEDLGYLEKTHISSGRVPSELGYRYYVDNLMELKKMNGEDVLKLQRIFSNNNLALSDSINLSLSLISELTSYTSVVLGETSVDNKLQKIEAVPIDGNNLIVVVITDLGHIEHKKVHLPMFNLKEIKKTVDIINEIIVGTPIDLVSEKLEFEVKPVIGDYVKQADVMYETFYNVFNDISKRDVNVYGRDNILKHIEFNDMDKVQLLLGKLEDDTLIEAIESTDDNINIYIGDENSIDKDVTVIKATYKDDTSNKTIAVIGPKRMEYERVVSLLEYIKKSIKSNKEE